MDMNRPVLENERPQSSRISSSKSNFNDDAPIEEPRSKSDLNENEVALQKDEVIDGQEENQHQEKNEIENEESNEKQDEIKNQDEDNNENQADEQANEVKEENEEKQQNEDSETNANLNETDNQNEISMDESNTELNTSENQEISERENETKDNDEQVYVHKTVKRKNRQSNKFADGNLILEEETDEDFIAKSPGPPPLEPISQNLDTDLDKSGQLGRPELELDANTPDKVDLTIDDDFQDIEVEIKPTREELIARCQAASEDLERLQTTNNQLHHKLADYFRKKKSDDSQNQSIFEKSQEQEQRFIKYITTIDNLKKQMETERLEAERELDELKYKCDSKKEMVDQERMTFTKMKKDAVAKSASSRSGRHLTVKDAEVYIEKERLKEIDVISVRIENIKLKNQLRKKENELKAKEEFGDGLHMIDFEQLKIENQTYNEKIEERNEELMKLKKKINNTVQILTHVKEKLQFVGNENEKEKLRLAEFDEKVKKNRDSLTKIKQSKDSLRLDNSRLKQNSGLLGNAILLKDFEECVDRNENLEIEIEQLKRKHAELILTSKGIKQKINQIKGQ